MPYILYVPGEAPHSLRWTDIHPEVAHGCGALVYEDSGDLLSGDVFRQLRDSCDARLETDHPDQARRALRLSSGEPLARPRRD
jgi:hypothetical protein